MAISTVGDPVLARRATFSEISLELDPGTSYDEWAEILTTLGRIHRVSGWWIGDAINFGERAYGETYSQALNNTGLSYQTLANMASVSRHIPPSRRREQISFAHHSEVAFREPEEQTMWLDKVESEEWTRNELRIAMRGEDPRPPIEPKEHICPECGYRFQEF